MFKTSFELLGIKDEKHKLLIFYTNFFGLIFLLLLVILCLTYSCNDFIYLNFSYFNSCSSRSENLIIVVFGLLIGWLMAMLFSPYSQKDGTVFSAIVKGVSIFFSGYLLNELSKHPEYLTFFLKRHNLILVSLFLSSILLSWLVVFSNRVYMGDEKKEDESNNKKEDESNNKKEDESKNKKEDESNNKKEDESNNKKEDESNNKKEDESDNKKEDESNNKKEDESDNKKEMSQTIV